jgi:ankyrin repeat protein
MVLPLSIEDESLTTGTALVLREFAKDLDITICKTDDHLTYNEHNKKFDINAACERYKFYEEMDWHAKDMEKLRNQLEESEPDDFETTDNITVDLKPVDSCQGGSFKQHMKQVSKNAKDVMKKLKNDILSFTKKKDRVLHLQSNSGLWVDLTDDNGCSPLHLAVEDKCVCLAESLILAGSNVNVSEGCGITPVMIAVNNNQPDIVRILVKYGAKQQEPLRKYTKSSSDSNANWKS